MPENISVENDIPLYLCRQYICDSDRESGEASSFPITLLFFPPIWIQ